MTDTLFDDFDFSPVPQFKKDKFKFKKGDEIKYPGGRFFIYNVTESYVTIFITAIQVTAPLMEHMEKVYGALYNGPVIDGFEGCHVTFRKISQ